MTFRLVLSTWYQLYMPSVMCRHLQSITDCSKQLHVDNQGATAVTSNPLPESTKYFTKDCRKTNLLKKKKKSITLLFLFWAVVKRGMFTQFVFLNYRHKTNFKTFIHPLNIFSRYTGKTWLHYQPLLCCVCVCVCVFVSLHFLCLLDPSVKQHWRSATAVPL